MIGILLVNLGSPLSFQPKDVKRFLSEFLTDKRVITLPNGIREAIVKGIIVPRRYKTSAKAYQEIWGKEGSPLLIYGEKIKERLQERLGDKVCVFLAMRYQEPSLKKELEKLKTKKLTHLLVLPLFPQYASATTGSVYEQVFKTIQSWPVIPSLSCVGEFATHPAYINAVSAIASRYPLVEYDQIVFSYHGLPEKQVHKVDQGYITSCLATTEKIAQKLSLAKEQYKISFQSRLGKAKWIEPYTDALLYKMAKEGQKKILVFCPSFVSDCLETLYEIKIEYQKEFIRRGGKRLDLVEGLNDHPQWIEGIETIVRDYLPLSSRQRKW